MTVTFNSIVLADGESRVAKVASGLAPGGEVQMEVLEFLRATWAVPVARGNRVMTLPMIISFPAQETFGATLVHALMYFANLPEGGTLVIAEGADAVTYSSAVCRNVKQVGGIEGLSHEVSLQFICGEPVNATLSPLAQMDARYKANLNAAPFSLTGLTGGTGKLDALATADVLLGFTGELFFELTSGVFVTKTFRLVTRATAATVTGGDGSANNDPSIGSLIIDPADYDADDNDKVWLETL